MSVPYVIRVALFADVIVVPLLSLYLDVRLRRLRKKELVDYHEVSLRRIGKFYYELNFHVAIRSQEQRRLLRDLIARLFSS